MAALRNLVTRMRIPALRHPRVSAASRGLSPSQDQEARMMYKSLHGYSSKDAKSINEKIKEFGAKWGRPWVTNSLGIASLIGVFCIGYQAVPIGLTMGEARPKQQQEAPKDMVDDEVPMKLVILGLVKAFMDQPGNLDIIAALMDKPLYEIEAWMDEAIGNARMKGATMDEASVKAVKKALLQALAGTEEEA